MDELWDSDIQTAKTLLNSADYHASLYTSQLDNTENLKHITIIRAKTTLLKKAINNLENIYSDFVIKSIDKTSLESKRLELDNIISSYNSLDLFVKNFSTVDQPSNANISYKSVANNDNKNLSNDGLIGYRDTLIRIQDDELDFLDNSASAIKSISYNIRDEVNLHTRLLGDMNTNVDNTYSIINRNRERFNEIIYNSNKRRLTFIIILLTIILFIVCFVF